MIKGLVIAWSGFYGGDIGNLLSQWEQMGIFSYVLPFLVLFALIFAILGQMKIFQGNRAVNSIIALAVALMALQFDFVPRFFSEVFPRLGVGLAVILVILILIGMFMNPSNAGLMWTLLGIGGVIAIVVLMSAGDAVGGGVGYWFSEHYGTVILVLIIVIFLGAVIFAGNKGSSKPYVSLGFGPDNH